MSNDSVSFDRVDPEGTRYELLPLHPDAQVYLAHYRSAEAIVQPMIHPTDPELRIPMVRRTERGDFKALMDEIVTALECEKIRFVGVETPDDDSALSEAWDLVSPDDARPLHEAVDGFTFDVMDYTHPDGEVEPCDCLVGEWSP